VKKGCVAFYETTIFILNTDIQRGKKKEKKRKKSATVDINKENRSWYQLKRAYTRT